MNKILFIAIIFLSCNRQQTVTVSRVNCDCIEELELSNYESETGEFNYAEDACELFRPGTEILEVKKKRSRDVHANILPFRIDSRDVR